VNLRNVCLSCLVIFAASTLAGAASCESLMSLSLDGATITLAQSVGAGEFSLPSTGRGAAQQNNAFKQIPRFAVLPRP
jgi:hypothetical protein